MRFHTWVFSGIGTLIVSIVVTAYLTRKPSDIPRDPTPTPLSAISPFPQNSQPPIATPRNEIDTSKHRADEEKAAQLQAEIQRLEDQATERRRAEAERLAKLKEEEARAEEERLEKQRDELRRQEERAREELRRQEERAREEAANTWHVARIRDRARVPVNYSVLGDSGQWQQYTVAPGATAGHGRHGDVVIEFDKGGGRGTKRLILNSSTVRTAHLSKADTESAPASYFDVLRDGSLGIFPR